MSDPSNEPVDEATHAVRVRKRLLVVETIRHEGGDDVDVPVRRAAGLAVIANPFAGRHVPGIRGFMEALKPLGLDTSAMKVGGVGARLDVPIGHVDAAYVRSHFDAMELGVPDAPRRDELVLILVMCTGGRVHARVGGLELADVVGEDGLR